MCACKRNGDSCVGSEPKKKRLLGCSIMGVGYGWKEELSNWDFLFPLGLFITFALQIFKKSRTITA